MSSQYTQPPQHWFSYSLEAFWWMWAPKGQAWIKLFSAGRGGQGGADRQPARRLLQPDSDPVAEPPSAEPTPPDGPTSLGPLDLLPSEELLTDTSNSSSSTGEEGEAGGLTHLLWLHETDFTQTG